MRRPRAMVLDEVWRRLDGVEALSGPHGGPLRRTVKLILDPLVIRPVQHPLCAGAILTADGAVLLAARVHAAADVLSATAAWFTVLKQTRRALRITEGNAQDLYFQRCFELATVSGMPDVVRDRAAAEAALREIHDMTAGRTTQVLKEYLGDPARAHELSELIATAWRRRPVTATADHTAHLADLLDACAAVRLGNPDPDVDIDDQVSAHIGTHSGIRLWREENAGAAQEFGLTKHPLPQPPRVGESPSTATLGLPFDRTIHERVFTVLQVSTERAELPPIPELVDAEIARACAPWALLDESLRVAAAAGTVLAVQLRPIDGTAGGAATAPSPDAAPAEITGDVSAARVHSAGPAAMIGNGAVGQLPDGAPSGVADGSAAPGASAARMHDAPSAMAGGRAVAKHAIAALSGSTGTSAGIGETARPGAGGTAAARVINSRWQREAYVLQARRLVVRADAAGPLAGIAADLRVPWRPYLRRLWARLHGRDVRELSVYEPDELWDLLDGVARSVILDHRMRVKRALATTAAEPELDPMESRAG